MHTRPPQKKKKNTQKNDKKKKKVGAVYLSYIAKEVIYMTFIISNL